MQIETVTVLSQKTVRGDYRLIKFTAPGIAPLVRPGQFVHLRITERNDLVLRRPFSVFNAGKHFLSILYKIVGSGTALLSGLRPGATLSMLGPIGNGFPLSATGEYPLFVAGGYGSAALYLLACKIRRKGTIFIGGKTKDDILCATDFRKIGWKVLAATEDGSLGHKGLVTDLLLKSPAFSEGGVVPTAKRIGMRSPISGGTGRDLPAIVEIFACGPMGMLKALSKIAIRSGIKAWLSLDRNMGCGVGACLGCVQKIKRHGGHGQGVKDWEWARICKDGPVFECREIVWE